MNGEQQKERRTAVSRIDGEIALIKDAWEAEVDSRLKAESRLEDLLASMIDGETQFRKAAITKIDGEMTTRINNVVFLLHVFIIMPWWKRLGWCLFGVKFLQWATRTPDLVLPTTPTQETLRKQASYTERPQ